MKEIDRGDLTGIPSASPLFLKTVAGDFLSGLLRLYPEPNKKCHPDSHIWGGLFKDRSAYESAHPEVRVFNRSSINLFPYFEASRIPTREELVKRVGPEDPATAALLESGVPESEISEAFAYQEECGMGGFQEIYRIRPVWGVYLSITNLADQPLRLQSLICEVEQPSGIGYRLFATRQEHTSKAPALPKMPLPPGATAVIPIATVLGPIQDLPFKRFTSEWHDVKTGESETISHCNGEELA